MKEKNLSDSIIQGAKNTAVVAGAFIALPLFGPVGAITATGAAFAAILGFGSSLYDYLVDG